MKEKLCRVLNMTGISNKVCACKGIRTCLFCEARGNLFLNGQNEIIPNEAYYYCIDCCKAWPKDNHNVHPHHNGEGLRFDGIHIITDFISTEEETQICEDIDRVPFVDSQSGRRKQDYGPKVNFKRKKVKAANFNGLPTFSKPLYDRMMKTDVLRDFVPVELCNLEYCPDRGSAIDPHFDDFWIWGDRLVTINLLSDSFLSMTSEHFPGIEVLVPLLRRSLIVVSGPARSIWKHAIHRKDITSRRIAVTLREFAEEFKSGNVSEAVGMELTKIALTFSGIPVGKI